MPTLSWIGKEAVENHHNEVPFRLLKRNNKLSVGEADSGNLLVQGDNLEALKALLPYYAGQVKCIYIDPPYNTGNEKWVYNDNVNSPEMKDWLGKVVGKEGEDLSRSDKWLCMMYPRLSLLKKFIREDGAIFVSIDDREVANLRLVLDEIFGNKNFICSFIWEKKHTRANDAKYVSDNHDFILLYAKQKENLTIQRLPRTEDANSRFSNPDNDPRGDWISQPLQVKTPSEEYIYEITTPSGRKVMPPVGRSWAFGKERYKQLLEEKRIYLGTNGNNVPRLKKFLTEVRNLVPLTIWIRKEVGDNQEAKVELKNILLNQISFDSPKPTRLIERIIQLSAGKDDIVMDSFAGSGTTGHAVLNMNKQDGGNRRFVLVEMIPDICNKITYNRLKSAIEGYTYNQTSVEGLGGGFSYCELGQSLFNADGQVRDEVSFNDLSRHIYFCETGEPLPKTTKDKSPLLGIHNETAVYLLYNGVLKDKKVDGGNVLTSKTLAKLPKLEGKKVIYGTACRFSDKRLRSENIIFKQTPYEIRIN